MLLLLMTIGGLLVAGILLAVSIWNGKKWLRNFVFGGVAIWSIFYIAMLFGFSIMSEEKNLSLNEPKEFCGFYFDCHMHTAITDVRKTKTIGDKTANGEFYIVKVKVFSDAKQAALGLHGPTLYVIDDSSRRYPRVGEVEAPDPPFDQKIPAGRSFEKEVVFDLPKDVKNARLDIAEGIGIDKVIESVLVGDEDSIFHKRKYFKLEEQTYTAAVQ